ncbi:MAG: transposase, partial [Candidatus Micrarchaeota archaeon]|nr:transposase [Candidatus Micrarchaeota archaeon]
SASYVANILKGNSSIQMRRIFPILKAEIRHALWADGYFVSTAGYISEDKVKRYIDEQMRHARQHEYQSRFGGEQQKLAHPFTPYPKGQGFSGAI